MSLISQLFFYLLFDDNTHTFEKFEVNKEGNCHFSWYGERFNLKRKTKSWGGSGKFVLGPSPILSLVLPCEHGKERILSIALSDSLF